MIHHSIIMWMRNFVLGYDINMLVFILDRNVNNIN
ncbi:hypothetical protein Xind_01594 [Xenorhabdus indica]|nr:hypothetical protein [Xenorhabdus indica]